MEEREGTANTTPLRRRPRPSYVEETTPETTDQSTLRTRERTLRRKGPFQSHGSHNSDESFAEDDHVSPSPSLRQGRTLATDSCGGAATGSPAPRRSSRSRRTTNTYQLRARKNSPSQQERIKKTGRDGSLNLNYLDSTSANSTPRTKPTVDIQKKIISSGKPIMSSAGKWREEQVLVICPGSRTTMAQLGCNELTPPTHRLQTRMFKDGDGWRPYHTYKRSKIVNGVETEEWVEDVDSDEGAVWPIQGGRIVNMEAFLAFLDHVHGMLTTTYHNTPIMLMASPQWLRPDCETIAQYIFEKTRTPALCLIHSAIATQYGLKQPSMTVVDIGYEKVDVTAIHDGRVVNHVDVGPPVQERAISGGEVFTRRLQKLLEGKGFTYEMAEQLKKSSICEVLTYAGAEEDLFELPRGDKTTGGAAKEDGDEPGKDATKATDVDPSTENGDDANDEGVLDVASIVTSGQTKEFLAKKEQEKKKGKKGKTQEPAEQTKLKQPNSKRARNTFVFEEVVQEEVTSEKQETTNGSAQAPAAAAAAAVDGPSAQPAEGETSTSAPADASGAAPDAPPQPPADQPMGDAPSEAPKEEASTQEPPKEASTEEAPKQEEQKPEEPKPEVATAITEVTGAVENSTEHRAKRVRRDIEVGLERFTFAERDEIDRIVTAIYRAIQGVDDMYMRPACWDNLVFVGNGSRLKGLKDNILQTLNARHLVSPSTATMFTSELPSNVATPTGTGSQTPTGSVSGAPHQLAPSGGVNPLLQAATTASSLGVAAPQTVGTPAAGSETGGPTAATTHHFHSQTPTSIKTLGLPTYLQEWTKNGFEESMFLGAQVAARIVFCLHSNMDAHGIEAQRLASLSRVDYNELGPKGIRTHSMLQ